MQQKVTPTAGVPAKIVKENIEWSRQTINDVVREEREKSR